MTKELGESETEREKTGMSEAEIQMMEELVEWEREREREMKKEIFDHVLNEEWDKVIEKYAANKIYRTAMLTKQKDTALHVAVLHAEPSVAKSIVKQIPQDEVDEILSLENELGDTPLHLAASRGDAQLCRQMLDASRALIKKRNEKNETPLFVSVLPIEKRNKKNETPLFVSVLRGNIEAYRILRLWKTKEDAPNYLHLCRSSSGNTILHSAIAGEHFSLALEIIDKYPDLISMRNEDGQTPLHILATKPNAFRSGKRDGPFDALLYHSIIVDEKKKTTHDDESNKKTTHDDEANMKKTIKCPDNYIICVNIFRTLAKLIKFCTNTLRISTFHPAKICGLTDEEACPVKSITEEEENGFLPPNWTTFSLIVAVFVKAFLTVSGIGSQKFEKMLEKKKKHALAVQIMKKLTSDTSAYMHSGLGQTPDFIDHTSLFYMSDLPQPPEPGDVNQRKGETALLVAAKNGVSEIVQHILENIPVAIHDKDREGKNVVLLAVENRQTHVFEFLKKESKFKDDHSVFSHADNEGNTAWHLAARLGELRPWVIAGEAMQMQWEYKWFKYVKRSMPKKFSLYNKEGKTPKQIFRKDHVKLKKSGNEWLTKTSESCSVVAALIAGVAFATSVTVPGGNNGTTGKPVLEGQTAFNIFSISSLVSLCFSLTALVFFLAILMSRSEEKDFHLSVPRKLLFGMSSLFISIASMLVTFCAGHFFLIQDKFAYAALPIYLVTCLPLTFFAFSQLHLYFDLIYAILTKIPLRSYRIH